MNVLVEYFTKNGDIREFTYTTNFKRINAKGLKDEAKAKGFKMYGHKIEIFRLTRI